MMDKNQDMPEQISQPSTTPDRGHSVQAEITDSSSAKSQQNMEVHQHGHLHFKTKWQEYIFQFLMLFLAVFLGFLAENKREHGVEKNKEKEYIQSLIEDLRKDSSLTWSSAESIYEQVKQIDNLQTLFSPDLISGSADMQKCYELSYYIRVYYTVSFNERTISQLISSGNMRLIKTKGVADSVMEYYSLIKSVNEQKQLYYNYINKCLESMYNIYDIEFLRTNLENDSLKPAQVVASRFLTSDPVEFKKLGATMEIGKVIAFLFSNDLIALNDKAIQLLRFLKEQYHIKN
jgi:hypothetical protein